MALVKAVALGAIASIGVPYMMNRATGGTAQFLGIGSLHVEAGGYHLYWSWPIFCVVTLAAWLLMKSAGAR